MVSSERLSWLAGLWDGEGSICLFNAKSQYNNKPKIVPAIIVTNCDSNIINEVLKIVDDLGTSLFVFEREGNEKHKASFQLTSRSFSNVKIILTAISPYLIGKKSQAEMVLRYINKRQRLAEEQGKKNYLGFDNDDWEMLSEVKRLNRRGPEPSETKDLTASADDIVQPTTQ